jgi:hypothetical protein
MKAIVGRRLLRENPVGRRNEQDETERHRRQNRFAGMDASL